MLKIGDGVNGPMQLAEFVIMNAYFKLGDQMFRQLIGIPMGANPSLAFAHLYLVVYEIQFMLQFLHSGGPYIRAFLQWLSFIHRFQDDVFVAHCKYIHDALWPTGLHPTPRGLPKSGESPAHAIKYFQSYRGVARSGERGGSNEK